MKEGIISEFAKGFGSILGRGLAEFTYGFAASVGRELGYRVISDYYKSRDEKPDRQIGFKA
jgi:hypothetical protein